MAAPKFKVNDIVVYGTSAPYELCIIDQVFSKKVKTYLKEQGFPPQGRPQGPEITVYEYAVYSDNSDQPELVGEELLSPIKNVDMFLILRRKDDTSSIDNTPARALAAQIIDGNEKLTHLEGKPYYECEDELTELINNYKP